MQNHHNTNNSPNNNNNTTAKNTELFDEMKALLQALPDKVFTIPVVWFQLGHIIYKEFGDTNEARILFFQYATKPYMCRIKAKWFWKHHAKAECGCTNGTKAVLYSWCKKSNPEKFFTIRNKFQNFPFDLINATNVAKFFIQWYGEEFMLDDDNELFWWDNESRVWNDEAAAKLFHIIDNEMFEQLQDLARSKFQGESLDQTLQELTKIKRRTFAKKIAKNVLTQLQ